jgi:hypothetical protein
MAFSYYFPTIEIAPGSEGNGMVDMLANLIRQNLEDRPDKLADFFRLRGRVAIVAEDVEVSLTLEFNRGQLTLHDGVVGIPDVTVRGDSDNIINMSLIEIMDPTGLPDPRGPVSRQIMAATRQEKIHVYGALRNPLFLLRLTRVMSVN